MRTIPNSLLDTLLRQLPIILNATDAKSVKAANAKRLLGIALRKLERVSQTQSQQ